MTLQRNKPCPACPWRIAASVDSIPRYDACKARNLASTVEQGWNKIMACHESPDGAEVACAGFMQSPDALNNFTVRLMVATGKLRTLAPMKGLHETFAAMASQKWGT